MEKVQIPVAKEGIPFIGLAAFVTLIMAILQYDFYALVALFLSAFVLYFFRDPARICPTAADALVSPADGKVIRIEKEFDDKYLNEQVIKISIFMNVFDVHVNRVPTSAKVDNVLYYPGRFYSANTVRGGLDNEKCVMIMTDEAGRKIAMAQIAGLIARRIVCWAQKGDYLAKGERCGLIRFGSRVDLFLPQSLQTEVVVGQRVRAGETVLGYMPQ